MSVLLGFSENFNSGWGYIQFFPSREMNGPSLLLEYRQKAGLPMSSLVAEWIQRMCYRLKDKSTQLTSDTIQQKTCITLKRTMGVCLPHHCWSGSRGYSCSFLAVASSFGEKNKIFFFFYSYLFLLSLSPVLTQRDMQQKHIKKIHNCAIPHIFGHLPLGLLFSHHLL